MTTAKPIQTIPSIDECRDLNLRRSKQQSDPMSPTPVDIETY